MGLREEGEKVGCEDITPDECKGPGYNGSYQTGYTDKHRKVPEKVFRKNWDRIFGKVKK